MKSLNLKILAITFLAVCVLTSSKNVTYAEIPDVCNPQDESSSKILDALRFLSLDTTGMGLAQTASAVIPSIVGTGMSPNGQFSCLGYIREKLVENGIDPGDIPECVAQSVRDCEQMLANYQEPEIARPFDEDSLVSGSLLGFTQKAEHAFYTPVPVNLAYYFKKQMEPVPYVGAALAAAPASYEGPYLNVVYEFWKAFRNAGYGLMGIVILITAILVATGKKIGSQTVVTVQYAIPRQIIALVMITFSYPIGATIASFGWVLDNSAKRIIYTLVGFGSSSLWDLGVGAVHLILGYLALRGLSGVGTFALAFAILLGIAVLFTYLLCVLKGIMLYIKMLIHIITAPFIMLRYAVPGNDSALTDWFKKFAVFIGGMFSIKMGIAITNIALVRILTDTTDGRVALAIPFIGEAVIAFIVIYGYNVARKLPDKLEASIMGKSR